MIIFEGLDEALKNRIQAGDEAAESELYEVMRKALIRMVDPDTLHDAYVAALVACRRGDVEKRWRIRFHGTTVTCPASGNTLPVLSTDKRT